LLNGGVSLLGRSLALGLPETYGFIQLFRE
jgi:hypothetical protein